MKSCSLPTENILFDMPAQGFCVLGYVDPCEITYVEGLNNIQQISLELGSIV